MLFCTAGKLDLADFRPNARIAGPDRPGFWGRPQMEVLVRVDNSHSNHGWNWVNGHFLSMDKGTTREMLGAQVFKVEIRTPEGPADCELFPRRHRSGPGQEGLRFNSEETITYSIWVNVGAGVSGRAHPEPRPRKRRPARAGKDPKR